jgi:hypothetical protein
MKGHSEHMSSVDLSRYLVTRPRLYVIFSDHSTKCQTVTEGTLLLVGSMAALNTKLVGQLAALLERAIRVTL